MSAKVEGIGMMRASIGLAAVLVALTVAWTPVKAAQIVITNSVECIDIPRQQTVDGAQVIIVHCNGRSSEKWTLANGQIVGIGGKCLDVAGGARKTMRP
jgi:hypothetical protein